MRINPTCRRRPGVAPGYAAFLLAYLLGIGAVVVLGAVIYLAAPDPAPPRRAAPGRLEEPVARRATWCPTPEQRAGSPPPDPEVRYAVPEADAIPEHPAPDATPERHTLTLPADLVVPQVRLMLRLHAIADEMAAERAEAPAEWRWKVDRARLHLAELIRDLEAGRLGQP